MLGQRVLAAARAIAWHQVSRRLRHLAVASTAAVLLGGCGEEHGRGQQDARLVVEESLPAMPRYTEGTVSFLRVENDDAISALARATASSSTRLPTAAKRRSTWPQARPCSPQSFSAKRVAAPCARTDPGGTGCSDPHTTSTLPSC